MSENRQPRYTRICSRDVKRLRGKKGGVGIVYSSVNGTFIYALRKKSFFSKRLKRRFNVYLCEECAKMKNHKTTIRELLDVEEPEYFISDRNHTCQVSYFFPSEGTNDQFQQIFSNLPPPPLPFFSLLEPQQPERINNNDSFLTVELTDTNFPSQIKKRKKYETGRTNSDFVEVFYPESGSGGYADMFVNLTREDANFLLQNAHRCQVMFGSVEGSIVSVRSTEDCAFVKDNVVSDEVLSSDFAILVYVPRTADLGDDVKLVFKDFGNRAIIWKGRDNETFDLGDFDLFD